MFFQDCIYALKDLCFPPLCLDCGAGLASPRKLFFCETCAAEIALIREPFCRRCGKPFHYAAGGSHLCSECLGNGWHFSTARAVAEYSGPVRAAIHALKYGGRTTALSSFGALKDELQHLRDMTEPDLVLPVPLHPQRLRERGFNQALLLAEALFPDLKKKISVTLLRRTRWKPPQTSLSGAARRKNIKGAFSVQDSKKVEGWRILLVDDVFTTGATVNECARVLQKAGAAAVDVITLARAVD